SHLRLLSRQYDQTPRSGRPDWLVTRKRRHASPTAHPERNVRPNTHPPASDTRHLSTPARLSWASVRSSRWRPARPCSCPGDRVPTENTFPADRPHADEAAPAKPPPASASPSAPPQAHPRLPRDSARRQPRTA